MPRVTIGDKTAHILRGIMTDRGINTTEAAEALRKPQSTVTYQIRHAETMSVESLRRYAELCQMTEAEIARVVRGG